MKEHTKYRLSKNEIEHYRSEGYVIPQGKVFSDEQFLALKEHFEKKLAHWPHDRRPEGMDTPHFVDPELFRWALAPEVVDLVEPLLGPDILLFSTHFICKPKGDGRRVPWHEDSAYWRKTLLEPMNVATVWLAIDDSTVENGCMRVIPRSHLGEKRGFSDYDAVDESKNVFPTEILPSQRKDELAIPCELAANHCSLHDARLQHGSPANRSNKRRCGWTLRFMSATVRLNPEALKHHVVYQARGRNVLEQPLGDPKQAYPEIMRVRSERGVKSH